MRETRVKSRQIYWLVNKKLLKANLFCDWDKIITMMFTFKVYIAPIEVLFIAISR